jgi:hypothetical protein
MLAVSVVPNYNHALFLHWHVASILRQTNHEFELILPDDRSTDNSRLPFAMRRQSSRPYRIQRGEIRRYV